MKKTLRVVMNADNEHVLPKCYEGATVGYVSEVNGEDGAEVSGFVPTRHELMQLAEYWQGVAIDRSWYIFTTGQVGSCDLRLREFALCRIDRIWDLIGEEATREAIDGAFATRQQDGRDARLWDIFLHGDDEAQRAVAQEAFREREEDRRAHSSQTEPPREETDE